MKAIRLLEWGQPVQLEDLPIPQSGDDDILVRVHAASLNPVDSTIASGRLQGMLTVPMTLGTDFAGEVVRVGSHVKHVQEASAVYGMIPFRGGTFAEYVLAKASEVAPKPARLDFVQAAAVPLTALTAWQALFDVAHLQAGERVLVLGAAGGVGSFAVQFAKRKGAVVIGTASSKKDEAFLRQDLGLDQVILPQEAPFDDVVTHCDVVLNLADPALSTAPTAPSSQGDGWFRAWANHRKKRPSAWVSKPLSSIRNHVLTSSEKSLPGSTRGISSFALIPSFFFTRRKLPLRESNEKKRTARLFFRSIDEGKGKSLSKKEVEIV